MRILKLKTKLAMSFMSISLITILIITALTNVAVSAAFKKHIKEKQEKRNSYFAEVLGKNYSNGIYPKSVLDRIEMYAMMDSLYVEITDEKNNPIWKANYIGHFSEMKEGIMTDIYHNDNTYSEKSVPIYRNWKEVGYVKIGYEGSYAMAAGDVNFLKKFNFWTAAAGIISMLAALLLNLYISRSISKPVVRVTETAKQIKDGNTNVRIEEASDIAEMKELTDVVNHLADSLEKQKILKKRLASDLAHEIRTPLATIRSHSEAMIDGVWDITRDRIESILEEIIRLSELVDGIEDIDNNEENKIEIIAEEFDIGEMLEKIKLNFDAEAAKKGIQIITEVRKGVLIKADKKRSTQIFVNLVSNAVKYNVENGRVFLKISEDEKNIFVRITDTGMGIKDDDKPFIFDRLFRGENSRARKTGGSGIGLAVVKSIVENQKWSIEVKSAIDKGTEVIVAIPKM